MIRMRTGEPVARSLDWERDRRRREAAKPPSISPPLPKKGSDAALFLRIRQTIKEMESAKWAVRSQAYRNATHRLLESLHLKLSGKRPSYTDSSMARRAIELIDRGADVD